MYFIYLPNLDLFKSFPHSWDITVVETDHISLKDLLNLKILGLGDVVPLLFEFGVIEIILILWRFEWGL